MRPHSKKNEGKEGRPLKAYSDDALFSCSAATFSAFIAPFFSLHCFDEFSSKLGLDHNFHFTVEVDTK